MLGSLIPALNVHHDFCRSIIRHVYKSSNKIAYIEMIRTFLNDIELILNIASSNYCVQIRAVVFA